MIGVTGETVAEAAFDRKVISWLRVVFSGILCLTVVGILLIPLWLVFSLWYGAEYMRRVSARLTTNAVEIRTGVFFRKESTIPLNRITDVRLHDDPVMRHYGIRGLKVETAGGSGQNSSSEGNLVGVLDAEEFRNAMLAQRQLVIDAGSGRAASPTVGRVRSPTLQMQCWWKYETSLRASKCGWEERVSSRRGAQLCAPSDSG